MTTACASRPAFSEALFDEWPAPSGIDYTEGLWTVADTIFVDDNPGSKLDPVHGVLLRDPTEAAIDDRGKILLFRDERFKIYNLNHPSDPDSSNFVRLNNVTEHEPFCAGHSLLPDGRLLIVGGDWLLSEETPRIPATRCWVGIWDPVADATTSWIEMPDTPGESENPARYYPTCVTLPDGSVLTVAGDYWVDLNGDEIVQQNEAVRSEVWAKLRATEEPTEDWQWYVEPNLVPDDEGRWMQYYPRIRAIPRGLFWEGRYYKSPGTGENYPWFVWPWDGSAALTDASPYDRESDRQNAAAVILSLYPDDSSQQGGKVLLVGGGYICPDGVGGGDQYRDALIYDYDTSTPSVTHTDDMETSHARIRPDAVMLPNGEVFVVGGHYWIEGDPDTTVVCESGTAYNGNLDCETFDPGSGDWTERAQLEHARMYHSQAFLLPDGRVFCSGNEGMLGAVGQVGITYELFIHPSLMDSGEQDGYAIRPQITAYDTTIAYDGTFDITVSPVGGASVDTVMIMHPSSVTHSNDTDQRRVVLSHTADGNDFTVNEPPDGTFAPPGDYLLFVLDDRGVWSEGKFLRLVQTLPSPAVEPNQHLEWTANQTLSADFVIAEGGTLSVGPGVVVTLTANTDDENVGRYPGLSEIINRGILLAEGTPQLPIRFQSDGGNPGEWGGLWFDVEPISTPAGYGYTHGSRLDHVEIEDATEGIGIQRPGAPSIQNVSFTNILGNRHMYVDHTDLFVPETGTWALASPCTIFVSNDGYGMRDIVANGDTLHAGRVDIVANGPFSLTGTQADSIYVLPEFAAGGDGRDWGGIFFDWMSSGNSLYYAVVRHAMAPISMFYQDASVRRSRILGFGEQGVWVYGKALTGPEIKSCIIARTGLTDASAGRTGIQVEKCTDVRIESCVVDLSGADDDAGGQGLRILNGKTFCLQTTSTADSVFVFGNEFSGPGGNPANVEGSWSGIRGDWACGASPRGVYLIENLILDWSGAGFRFEQSSDVQVSCNRVQDCAVAVEFSRDGLPDSTGVRFRENVLRIGGYQDAGDQDNVVTTSARFLKLGPTNFAQTKGQNQLIVDGEDYYVAENDVASGETLDASNNFWSRDESPAEEESDVLAWVRTTLPGSPPPAPSVDADPVVYPVNSLGCVPAGPSGTRRGPSEGMANGRLPGRQAVGQALPRETSLQQARPTPFRGATELRFELARPERRRVTIEVFDVAGRLVRTILDEDLPGGRYGTQWDGMDAGGDGVASGVYFVRLRADKEIRIRKVVSLR